ncbi:sensor histidine kinase [Anaeromyxobacter dehalogenans]|uniref:histidine kinase n=1 Tax=Anaeromyxobacter dehalogenans (strain 2CP-C) TaxID=290397 RepID=Q2IHD4_ANADE|nr:PAS domain-containing sensor histidine kinase [Anaeromyxobacter dehalogenans]ABC83990.1 periplasmic sensor signal transduction histidine kinase [Anaeromyxobacter dehalogenans 2CP-C]
MRFGAKIGLVLLAVGVLPVALLGLVSYTVSRDELQRTVGRMQVQAAEDLALFTERFVGNSVESLRLAVSAMPFDEFSRGELSAVLDIPYRQLPFVSILVLVDDANTPVAGPVFERRPERDPALAGREPVDDRDLDRFARQIPRAPAKAGATTISAPYRGERGPARIAVALRIGKDRTLAAEILLRDVEHRIAELSGAGGLAYLVDGHGELIAGVQAGPLTTEERRLSEVGFGKGLAWSRLVRRQDGERWLSAFAPLGSLGWGAVVAQPMAVAFSAAERLRFYTVGWSGVALVLALLVGAFLARMVTRPVQRLSRAAAAIAAGDYSAPVSEKGRDEIAELGRAFARMTGELRRRDEEIRGWNRELQSRVEERTAELKTAQDQILRTRRLAALGSLGAGLAHELNNPMTAIVGYLAILKRELPAGSAHAEMIGRAQEQTARVARVVEDLRSFADQERSMQGRRFSLVGPVRAALALYEDRLRAAGIELTTRFDERLPDAQGDPVQIQQVVAHLVENAINAMPRGGSLEVSLGTVDGEALRLRIADTGKGIPVTIRERIFDPFFTTKEHPGRVGLGLSVSHSIVEAHHGRIVVESEEGAGAAITVLLPAATAAHLA